MKDLTSIQARLAGLLVVLVIGFGMAGNFIETSLVVRNDVSRTALNLLQSETLFRVGAASQFLGTAAYVGVTALFFLLLRPAGEGLSVMAVLFSTVGIAGGAVSLVSLVAPLSILNAPYTAALSQDQVQSLAYVALRLNGQGYNIAMMFFGCYCITIGVLIVRSRMLPRVIGWLMAAAGASYLINGFAIILSPPAASVISPWIVPISAIGEGSMALWLLFVGRLDRPSLSRC